MFLDLAHGVSADATDDYIKIDESTTIKRMKIFCQAIVEINSLQYIQSPTSNDVSRLLHIGEKRSFRGMLGSLDCMHWKWKNFSILGGTICRLQCITYKVLETVFDYDIWI